MLNLSQLKYAIDSLTCIYNKRKNKYNLQFTNKYSFKNLNTLILNDTSSVLDKNIINNFSTKQKQPLLATAKNIARTNMTYSNTTSIDLKYKKQKIQKHYLEKHRKFTLSFACLLLFFIGAPLGSIIRKGGLGMPMVASIGIFLLYHICSITSEKMSINGLINPFLGMWLSSMIFLPIGIILTYKATSDSSLFQLETYQAFIYKKRNENSATL